MNLKKPDNRSEIELCPITIGHKINFEAAEMLQERFGAYEERFTAKALSIWVNQNELNGEDRIQLAIPW